MKLTLLKTARGSMQFHTLNGEPTLLCRFDGQMLPIEDVISLLICAGMSTEEIAVWLQQRMGLWNYTPITEVIQ